MTEGCERIRTMLKKRNAAWLGRMRDCVWLGKIFPSKEELPDNGLNGFAWLKERGFERADVFAYEKTVVMLGRDSKALMLVRCEYDGKWTVKLSTTVVNEFGSKTVIYEPVTDVRVSMAILKVRDGMQAAIDQADAYLLQE